MQFIKNYPVESGIEVVSFKGGSSITIPDPSFPGKRIKLTFPTGCLIAVENYPIKNLADRKHAQDFTTAHYENKGSIVTALGEVMADIKRKVLTRISCVICYGEIPPFGKRVLQVRGIVFKIIETRYIITPPPKQTSPS